MKRIGIYPGSFDPVTNGHIDLIERALRIVDELIVAVAHTASKESLFSISERVGMLKEATSDIPNVRVSSLDGLLVDYARKEKAQVIIRGVRAVSDFEYEFQMALMNRKLNKDVETVFMMPDARYSFLSSSIMKEVVSFGGSLCDLVPPVVEKKLREKLASKLDKPKK